MWFYNVFLPYIKSEFSAQLFRFHYPRFVGKLWAIFFRNLRFSCGYSKW